MGLRRQMLMMLVLVVLTYTSEAALLLKPPAANFLSGGHKKRVSRCQSEDCSSEESQLEELPETHFDYEQNVPLLFNVGSEEGLDTRPGDEPQEEGSGM